MDKYMSTTSSIYGILFENYLHFIVLNIALWYEQDIFCSMVSSFYVNQIK